MRRTLRFGTMWRYSSLNSSIISIILTVFLITILLIYHTFREIQLPSITNLPNGGKLQKLNVPQNQQGPRESFQRIVHLDLKGAPPKIVYFKRLFPLLNLLGATGLLVEYEDMFPYKGQLLDEIPANNAYTLKEISELTQLAKRNNLMIIPLVQTFGHLEFILKLPQFQQFRENRNYPQTICATHNDSVPFILEMIEQIMRVHPDSQMIHIGADEVHHLGQCDRCLAAMDRWNLTRNTLFLRHLDSVINGIQSRYPRLEILMWDDEFRGFSLEELTNWSNRRFIQPVVGKFTKDVVEELGPSLWTVYSKVFPSSNLWAGSAFKGATGSDQYVCDVTHYVQNHRSWNALFAEQSKSTINFAGIILMGWQRYDHFAILCELLPVAMPSLALSLRVIGGHDFSPLTPPVSVAQLLGCQKPYGLIGAAFGTPHCTYPGGDILENVLRLQQLRAEYETIETDSRVRGWLTPYNMRYEFSNPEYARQVISFLEPLRNDLLDMWLDMEAALTVVYDNSTVLEWKETYISPFLRDIDRIWKFKNRLFQRKSWPKRPLSQLKLDKSD